MAILKVKDEKGEWVVIPALKGDKGEKGEDGVVNVDQIYNPESENAQSGKAVAGAVASAIGDISSVLDELHVYAQNLINGGAE